MPASLAGLTVPGPLHPVSPPGPPLGTPDPVRSEDPPASWWQASVLPGSHSREKQLNPIRKINYFSKPVKQRQ